MQTPTQGRSPRFRVAKPLKGFAPLLFRECRRLSSCKRRMCPLWSGRDITPTLLSNAWRIRSVLCRTKSAIFQGRPQCPLLVGLCLQSRLHHALPFSGTYTLYATRQTFIATNRQIVRTPSLNEANIFRQTFLWEVVDCHFTLPLCSSRVGFSPPCFCLGDGESLCQKGDSPM